MPETNPCGMILSLVLAALIGLPLMAEVNHPQPAPISRTERMEFPSGGKLHIENSHGELIIQGWDDPTLEITLIKRFPLDYRFAHSANAVKELDSVRTTTERRGDELVVRTVTPKAPALARLLKESRFDLEYRIFVPRTARLTIDHKGGEVHIESVTGDLHIENHSGQITVGLPPDGRYAIDARAKIGAIDSDFEGHESRNGLKFGHSFTSDVPSSQRIWLRSGFGDITILNLHRPPTLPPFTSP